MEKTTIWSEVPERIYNYILNWFENHREEYKSKYGNLLLSQLTPEQLHGLFYIITLKDLAEWK